MRGHKRSKPSIHEHVEEQERLEAVALGADLRIEACVRALSQGREITEAMIDDYGVDVVEDAITIWETLETSQREIRSWATGTLVGLLRTPNEAVRRGAAADLLVAADRAVMTRARYDDLSDPQVRQAAVHELRNPSAGLVQVILEAWSKPQIGVTHVWASLLSAPHPALVNELERLGWHRGSMRL